jgi:hypothetical protein
MASRKPALYSAGLARSTNRNGPLIFSMWMRPLNRLHCVGELEDSSRSLFRIGERAVGSQFQN